MFWPSAVWISWLRLKLQISLPLKSRWMSARDSCRPTRAPLAAMTSPFGNIRAGPPDELLNPSHRLTVLPFMSMTTTACVPKRESTV